MLVVVVVVVLVELCALRLEPRSTRVIVAGKVLPGKASTVKVAACPCLTVADIGFVDRDLQLHRRQVLAR